MKNDYINIGKKKFHSRKVVILLAPLFDLGAYLRYFVLKLSGFGTRVLVLR
jgi:hypothetical protein